MQPTVHAGDIAIVTGAIRDEGTTIQYLPMNFPAVANIDVVCALREAASKLGLSHHLGIAQSKDSFYGEVERKRMPMAEHLKERWDAWVAGGAICSEMESSALFVLSSIYRTRAGGAMLVVNESELAEFDDTEASKHMNEFDADSVIRVGVEAIKILIAHDKQK